MASQILLAPLICLLSYAIGTRELQGRWSILFLKHTPLALVLALLLAGIGLYTTVLPVWLVATLAGLLVAIAWLDLETGMLADALTATLGSLALVWLGLQHGSEWVGYAPQLAVGFGLLALGWFFAGPYSRWRGHAMLGWGDVKFFAAAGLWLAPLQLPLFLILAGGIGAVVALVYKLKTGQAETPFAPALCLALFTTVVFGLSL